jgi:hypothetical protein
MNRVELAVYNLVKRNPRLKMGIRNAYQRVCDAFPAKSVVSTYPITVREGYFFGFHDKCPWSPDDSRLLANQCSIPPRMPRSDDHVTVGYFTGEDFRNFKPVAQTNAWNWQQGCMLQWIGGTNSFIFNDFDGASHVARIYDDAGKFVRTLPVPIAALSPSGDHTLSYSFERCHVYAPGYGYVNGKDTEQASEKPRSHGIQVVDLASGRAKHLFSVSDIASLQPDQSMEGAHHYVSHCQFNPLGSRFVFFHRWIKDFNFLRTRMLSCDLAGKDLFVFPTDGMVSHVAWRDDSHILAYARIKGGRDRYVLFEDKTGGYMVVGAERFNSDGHPSFSPNRRWILTDTYPDRFRVSNLILYDTQTDKRFDLARLRSPREFASPNPESTWPCDLHPRWDRSGTLICFDSPHTGRRALCTIRLGDFEEEGPKCV